MKRIISELRRREVFKAGAAYVVVAWLLLQVTDIVVPILELPDWTAKLVLFLLMIGFPIALILAWAYDLTSSGVRREKAADEEQPTAQSTRGSSPVSTVQRSWPHQPRLRAIGRGLGALQAEVRDLLIALASGMARRARDSAAQCFENLCHN
jgi:hypothetical protein